MVTEREEAETELVRDAKAEPQEREDLPEEIAIKKKFRKELKRLYGDKANQVTSLGIQAGDLVKIIVREMEVIGNITHQSGVGLAELNSLQREVYMTLERYKTGLTTSFDKKYKELLAASKRYD